MHVRARKTRARAVWFRSRDIEARRPDGRSKLHEHTGGAWRELLRQPRSRPGAACSRANGTLLSAAGLRLPRSQAMSAPEIAFAGRSNVGRSKSDQCADRTESAGTHVEHARPYAGTHLLCARRRCCCRDARAGEYLGLWLCASAAKSKIGSVDKTHSRFPARPGDASTGLSSGRRAPRPDGGRPGYSAALLIRRPSVIRSC